MRDLVIAYSATPEEAAFRLRLLELIKSAPSCFYRNHFVPGHVTGSALLLSADGRRVLLNHHKSLNKWLCFGGHADGSDDILDVARRELAEESGIENADVIAPGIHDIDIHPIPANAAKGEPAHEHFDVRFIFRARDENFKISDESAALKWCAFDEAFSLVVSSGMKRLLKKALAAA